MLDYILEQNSFGRPDVEEPPSNLELSMRKSLEIAERNITHSVENQVRELIRVGVNDPSSIEAGLQSIRSNIEEYSGHILEGSAIIDALKSFNKYPAFYVLLAAILNSGVKST